MGKKRGSAHEVSDQFGEFTSQDRDEKFQSSSKGFSGGGSAGGSRRSGANVTFQKHVPKFLQKYSHMLRGNQEQSEEPTICKRAESEDEADADTDAEAFNRALMDNPELRAEYGEKFEKKARAAQEKEKGNQCFSEKQYDKAIVHFTNCIDLDPECAIYFSNRSAAYSCVKRWQEALEDAQTALRLHPGWSRAYSRIGAAYFALGSYSEAVDAYQAALAKEPHSKELQAALEKAQSSEAIQERDHVHVFKKRQMESVASKARPQKKTGKEGPADLPAPGAKPKSLLSFAEEDV